MSQQMIVWIVAAIFLVPGFILSGVLLSGKGSALVLGFGSLSKEEQAKWNKKAICRFVGAILLIFMVLLAVALVLSIYTRSWIFWIFIVLACGELTAGVTYMNRSDRFKKD